MAAGLAWRLRRCSSLALRPAVSDGLPFFMYSLAAVSPAAPLGLQSNDFPLKIRSIFWIRSHTLPKLFCCRPSTQVNIPCQLSR